MLNYTDHVPFDAAPVADEPGAVVPGGRPVVVVEWAFDRHPVLGVFDVGIVLAEQIGHRILRPL